jgi:hypothetical protein
MKIAPSERLRSTMPARKDLAPKLKSGRKTGVDSRHQPCTIAVPRFLEAEEHEERPELKDILRCDIRCGLRCCP